MQIDAGTADTLLVILASYLARLAYSFTAFRRTYNQIEFLEFCKASLSHIHRASVQGRRRMHFGEVAAATHQ